MRPYSVDLGRQLFEMKRWEIIQLLHENGILNEENLSLLLDKTELLDGPVWFVLNHVHMAKNLTSEHFRIILNLHSDDIDKLWGAFGFERLSDDRAISPTVLAGSYLKLIISSKFKRFVCLFMNKLVEENIQHMLPAEHLARFVKKHNKDESDFKLSEEMTNEMIVNALRHTGFYTKQNMKALRERYWYWDEWNGSIHFLSILNQLKLTSMELLTQKNFYRIAGYGDQIDLLRIMKLLRKTHLLTQNNLTAVLRIKSNSIDDVADFLKMLEEADALNQQTLDLIIDYARHHGKKSVSYSGNYYESWEDDLDLTNENISL